jgi:hypothetical protein
MYGIALLKLVVSGHSLVASPPPPPPPPAPVVVSAPAPTVAPSAPVAAPVVTAAPVVATTTTTAPAPVQAPVATPLSSVECVVHVPGGATFGPGPVDADGSCAAYVAEYPAPDTVTPTPEAATYYPGDNG